ncbi:MAG: DUF6512 family protein [Chloroflexota bacterium]|nr:DUF6512 family protein [Chloroflexota bacterium]
MAMRSGWLRWELLGIPLIFLAGSTLHFVFAWCGRAPFVAPFAAVNESTREHLKLAFWPSVIYAAVEYIAFGRKTPSFAVAKSVGILIMPLCVVVLFYGYKVLLGHHLVWLDILIFLVAVSAGQMAAYLLMSTGRRHERWVWIGLLAVALLGVCFALFTFRPPHLPVFRDSVTGKYGIAD